jgi:hypothetical protein
MEPLIDLHRLLNQVYDLNRVDMEIDYHQDPVPPISFEDKPWMNSLLQAAQLH